MKSVEELEDRDDVYGIEEQISDLHVVDWPLKWQRFRPHDDEIPTKVNIQEFESAEKPRDSRLEYVR